MISAYNEIHSWRECPSALLLKKSFEVIVRDVVVLGAWSLAELEKNAF
jgi:hypothetical protein